MIRDMPGPILNPELVGVGEATTVPFPAYETVTAFSVYAISANGTYDPLLLTSKVNWTVAPLGVSTLFRPCD
jgi:hypothetical protein